ncbi:hypothetical protein ACWA3P_24615, partial [Escherichia coli]
MRHSLPCRMLRKRPMKLGTTVMLRKVRISRSFLPK